MNDTKPSSMTIRVPIETLEGYRGRDIDEYHFSPNEIDPYNFIEEEPRPPIKYPWTCSLLGNDRTVYLNVTTPPNWFHRQMQRWLLGIKWKKNDD